MDMEIARLTNVTWLPAPDRQVVAMRKLRLSSVAPRVQLNTAQPPVPMLAWPQDLFQDETLDH